MMRKVILSFTILSLLTLLLSACSYRSEELGPFPGEPKNKCPKLDSRLYGLARASDPVTFAKEHGIYYKDGITRVTIELVQEAKALPQGYDIVIEIQVGNRFQALVPTQQLCLLANEPSVRWVEVPAPAKPMGK